MRFFSGVPVVANLLPLAYLNPKVVNHFSLSEGIQIADSLCERRYRLVDQVAMHNWQ